MNVILLERIEKLGVMGEEVRVKPGYAKNYLLPQKKALRANPKNRVSFEKQRVHLEELNHQRREEAQLQANSIEGMSVLIIRQASESGQLYGSVSGRDIADILKEKGAQIERRFVNLNTPLKSLGRYDVALSLHPEVSVSVEVIIARSEEEAKNYVKKPKSEEVIETFEE